MNQHCTDDRELEPFHNRTAVLPDTLSINEMFFRDLDFKCRFHSNVRTCMPLLSLQYNFLFFKILKILLFSSLRSVTVEAMLGFCENQNDPRSSNVMAIEPCLSQLTGI